LQRTMGRPRAGLGESFRFPVAHTLFLLALTNVLTAWTTRNLLQSPFAPVVQTVVSPTCPQCPPPAPVAAVPQRTSTHDSVPAILSTPSTSGDPYTGYTPSSAVLLQQRDDKVVDLAFRDGQVVPAVSRTRVYCMVPASVTTQQARNGMRAFDFVLATWGPRCDVLKFFVGASPGMPDHYTPNVKNGGTASLFSTGQQPHPGLKGAPIVEIDMTRPDCNNKNDPKCRNIWEKVHRSWAWVWKHDLDTADWFLKVDYDTYLFVDNLKDYLRPLDPSKELYLGHNVYQHVHTGGPVFNQGGATVFAHATLDKMGRFFQEMRSLKGGQHTWTTECVDRDGAQEEWGISNCLRRMNITATNTADALGRERFIPFQLHSHLRLLRKDGPGGWYWANKPDGVRDGVDCCAHDLIMVHSYKSDAYDSIIRWLEYEHFERAHQAVYKDLIQTAQQLQLAREATG